MGAMAAMTNYETVLKQLADGKRVLIDGGTGTEIERRGVAPLDDAWSSTGALDGPDVVRQVHEDYLRSGARIVISNTFSTSRHALRDGGIADQFDFLNRQGVELARAACEAVDPSALVAGGITDWTWTGNVPPIDELAEGARQQAEIMADAGADLIMLEMMSHIDQTLAVLDATRECGLPVWVGFSCEVIDGEIPADGEAVRLLGGPSLADGVAALNELEVKVPVVSIMHTEVEDTDPCLDVLDRCWQGVVGVYAHSGRFVNPNWIFNGIISPDDYAMASKVWLDRGVQILGGCCGIGPDHLDLLAPLVDS